MFSFNDVVHRHPVYFVSVLTVMLCSGHWAVCAVCLSAAVGVLKWHSGAPWQFLVAAGTVFTIVEVLLVSSPARTMNYDYAVPALGVPLWLVPWWALRAHWALDLYRVCGGLVLDSGEKDGSSVV